MHIINLNQNKRVNAYFILISIVVISAALFTSYLNYQHNQAIIENNRVYAERNTEKLANQLEDTLIHVSQITRQLAQSLNQNGDFNQTNPNLPQKDPQNKIWQQLEQTSKVNNGFLGLGAAYHPFEADKNLRLFAPYIYRENGHYHKKTIDRLYDYTHQPNDTIRDTTNGEYWFYDLNQIQSGWLPPYVESASDHYIAKYGSPIRKEGFNTPIGYAYATLDLDRIQALIQAVDFGSSGYALLLSPDNRLLFHSLTDQNNQTFSVKELYPEISLTGASGSYEITSELTQNKAWLHYQKVSPANWYLLSIVDYQTPLFEKDSSHPNLINAALSNKQFLLLSYLASLILLTFWILKIFPNHQLEVFFIISLSTSLLFLGGMMVTWNWQLKDIYSAEVSEEVMSNKAAIDELTREYSTESLHNNLGPPIFIPTGCFVQSIEFQSAYNINITGYVWQKIPLNDSLEIEPGVIFPEAEDTQLQEAYRYEENGELVIGWYFNVMLRENFDYSTFPFDKQSVWIRFWPKSFGKNIVLIPDLSSYVSINPSTKAGLEKDFVVAGWEISDTHFDIRFNAYNTNFGLPNVSGDHRAPELYFNVGMVRNFTNHFITNVFPIIVVLLMLFSILVTTSRGEHHISLLGFNASAVLASASALFFVVLISHIELRSELEVNEIIYLEYFYLITYAVILLISLNSIIFTWGLPISLVQYKNNIIPKLLYGPMITGAMFLVTFITFGGFK